MRMFAREADVHVECCCFECCCSCSYIVPADVFSGVFESRSTRATRRCCLSCATPTLSPSTASLSCGTRRAPSLPSCSPSRWAAPSPRNMCRYGAGIACELEHLRTQAPPLAHWDWKPSNVLLAATYGGVCVCVCVCVCALSPSASCCSPSIVHAGASGGLWRRVQDADAAAQDGGCARHHQLTTWHLRTVTRSIRAVRHVLK